MTKIQWTDETWNPLRARRKDGGGKVGWACVRVSPGCVNCYAATQNRQMWAGGTGLDYTVPNLKLVETVRSEKALTQPLRWKKARRVFVCSMTDLFGEWVTDDEIEAVFGVMAQARQHTFQVLTKRPERMRAFLADIPRAAVLPNVWLGTSVEDQQRANERIPHLLATPAAVRFLSCEPLLGPIDLRRPKVPALDTAEIDWVIVGGESGARARPMNVLWVVDLVDQCRAAGIAPFVKQLGAKPYIDRLVRCDSVEADLELQRTWLNLADRKGGDINEWREDLRVREWPVAA